MEKMRYTYVWFSPPHWHTWRSQWEMDTFIFTASREWVEHATPLGSVFMEVHSEMILQSKQFQCNCLAYGLFSIKIWGECYWRVPAGRIDEVLPAINEYKKTGTPIAKQVFPKLPQPQKAIPDWIKKMEFLRRQIGYGRWL